jgi:hypothetical protein
MEQIRENGLIDKIMLCMRYSIDSEELAEKICLNLKKKQIPYRKIEPSKFSKWKTGIIIDDLDEITFDPYFIKKMNDELSLKEINHDFFFGITSRYTMGGFTLPNSVLEYLNIIGGEVHFSYATS